MADIIEVLKEKPYFCSLSGVDESDIFSAEGILKVKFADEYIQYLKEFGVASVDGHELTGICKFPRLNVVDVTLEERNLNPDIPKDLYVLEQANIDDIVIWQNQYGCIYQSMSGAKIRKICNSICEYLEL